MSSLTSGHDVSYDTRMSAYVQTDRKTDRLTDRQTDKETDRQTDRQTDRPTERDRQTDRQRPKAVALKMGSPTGTVYEDQT